MLNDNEKKILVRYALIPKLIRASMWMIPGVIALTFLLEFINEAYMYGRGTNSLGIAVTVGVIIFFIIVHFWGRMVLRRAPYDATWQALTHRIETVYIRDYVSGDELSLADISKAKKSADLSSFDQYLHEAFHIFDYYPKTLLKRVLFVVLPCLLIVGSYIPTYIDNYVVYEESREEVSKVMTALEDAFDSCYRVYYDDPYEYYYEYGYYFMAYPDYDMDDYIAIDVLNDGTIDFVSYRLTIDLSVDIEENLADMQGRLDQLYDMLASADISIDQRYLTEPLLDDGFTTAFLGPGEYQDIAYSRGNIYISFYISETYDDIGTLYISVY